MTEDVLVLVADCDGEYDVLGAYTNLGKLTMAVLGVSVRVHETTKRLTKAEFMSAYANDEDPEPTRVWSLADPGDEARHARATLLPVADCAVPTYELGVFGSDMPVEPRVLVYALRVPVDSADVGLHAIVGALAQ